MVDTQKEKTLVLVGGCFDVLHVGHIHFLTQAKKLGDILIVALESDKNVRIRKGNNRPIHTQEQRKSMLEALLVVNEVITLPTMKHDSEYRELVLRVKPHIIAVTEGDPYILHKKKQAEMIQATVIEISKSYTPSTSQLAKLIGLE
jgi:rfaE bifunctional protein nucleotidyltransferase chain/domain